ncbi:MAG: ABC transporter substrate-binding protein [Robiginitalea sp.]|uniref:ABC transporter substrate-binding protein n=1 Tax=Robiginitalea sp. TaxID=1902411 RepID=UPI003C778AA6
MRIGYVLSLIALVLISCRRNPEQKQFDSQEQTLKTWKPRYAQGFYLEQTHSGISYLYVNSPWPGASKTFRYALVPRAKLSTHTHLIDSVDGVIGIPVKRAILTSTTHIPPLETLEVEEHLVGFPGLGYISSPGVRERIDSGNVEELGVHEALNTELAIALNPDVVVGFGVSGAPSSYTALEASGIPIVYNGDWMEENPLGKAEWIVFFGLLFDKKNAAERAFSEIEKAYLEVRDLAAKAPGRPTVLSGSLYRDIWYLPGGSSWAAQFIKDAHAQYLWESTPESGSLSLSLESVLEKGSNADLWIAPSQFTSYGEMEQAEAHYSQFKAFREEQIYTYALSTGPGKGLLYYELGPSRPDLILKDLVYWFHPGLLKGYDPTFFKPLEK